MFSWWIKNFVWVVRLSNICVIGLAISRPSRYFQNREWSENNLRRITSRVYGALSVSKLCLSWSWFPVRTAHSREFVYDFCFGSCKMSQNVAFRIYLHEVNSKFHVNRHFRREAFMLHSFWYIAWWNLHSCKNQWSCWKKSLKGLKDKVCDS